MIPHRRKSNASSSVMTTNSTATKNYYARLTAHVLRWWWWWWWPSSPSNSDSLPSDHEEEWYNTETWWSDDDLSVTREEEWYDAQQTRWSDYDAECAICCETLFRNHHQQYQHVGVATSCSHCFHDICFRVHTSHQIFAGRVRSCPVCRGYVKGGQFKRLLGHRDPVTSTEESKYDEKCTICSEHLFRTQSGKPPELGFMAHCGHCFHTQCLPERNLADGNDDYKCPNCGVVVKVSAITQHLYLHFEEVQKGEDEQGREIRHVHGRKARCTPQMFNTYCDNVQRLLDVIGTVNLRHGTPNNVVQGTLDELQEMSEKTSCNSVIASQIETLLRRAAQQTDSLEWLAKAHNNLLYDANIRKVTLQSMLEAMQVYRSNAKIQIFGVHMLLQEEVLCVETARAIRMALEAVQFLPGHILWRFVHWIRQVRIAYPNNDFVRLACHKTLNHLMAEDHFMAAHQLMAGVWFEELIAFLSEQQQKAIIS